MNDTTLYEQLAEPFEETATLRKGGKEFTYIPGDDVIHRLNDVLGAEGWEFSVRQHLLTEDQVVVLGSLTIHFPDRSVTHEQWGGQPAQRLTSTGAYMDLGNDFKGATTDALKKCATMSGVGLYLYDKPTPTPANRPPQQRTTPPSHPPQQATPPSPPSTGGDPISIKQAMWFDANIERARILEIDLAPFDLEHMTTATQAALVAPKLLAKIQAAEALLKLRHSEQVEVPA